MSFVLRPYQERAVDASIGHLTGDTGRRGALCVAPTGSGKSLIIADVVRKLPGRTVIFQPSKEILEQNAYKLVSYGEDPAIFSASMGRRDIGQITLSTVGTAIKSPHLFKDTDYVIVDECHLVNPARGDKPSMYRRLFDVIPKAKLLGLTATPYRLHSNSMGSVLRFITRTRPRVFHDLVHYDQISDLFDKGYLCPLKYKPVPIVRPEKLKLNSKGTDFTDKSVQEYFKKIQFAKRLAEGVRRLLDAGRKYIAVFTRFTDEAEYVAKELGPIAAVVSAKTTRREREEILARFRSGQLKVVTNVGVIAIGFDFPELDTVVCARPSLSLSVYYQQVGRVVRTHKDKKWAAVVDCVGLMDRFGKIEDLRLKLEDPSKPESHAYYSGNKRLTNKYFGTPSRW
jgi:DNA repair protein RadD